MKAERYGWLLALVASGPATAVSAADAPPSAKAAPVAALSAADAELLEFLGEFRDAGGEFVDPFVIDAVGGELDAARRAEAADAAAAEVKVKEGADAAPKAAADASPETQR